MKYMKPSMSERKKDSARREEKASFLLFDKSEGGIVFACEHFPFIMGLDMNRNMYSCIKI